MADDEFETIAVDPFAVAEPKYKFPACRGRHRKHSYVVGECKLGGLASSSAPTSSMIKAQLTESPGTMMKSDGSTAEEEGHDELLERSLIDPKESGLNLVETRLVAQTTGAEKAKWIESMQRELDSMRDLGVYRPATSQEIAQLRPSEILPAKCVFGTKPVEIGKPERKYKCRAVVCGNFEKDWGREIATQQIDGTILGCMAVMLEIYGWTIQTGDVTTAFHPKN